VGKIFKIFVIQTLILNAILAIVGGLVYSFIIPQHYFTAFPFVFFVFPAVSIFVFSKLLRTTEQNQSQFNIAFMLSFIIKLVIYAAFVGVGLAIDSTKHESFVIFVMITYLVFSISDTKATIKAVQLPRNQ